jgi:Spy/CpxP family protein refolding chaperone
MMVGIESVELIRAKNQQLVTLHQEIKALSFESMLAIREILTPQQRQKFRELVDLHLTP